MSMTIPAPEPGAAALVTGASSGIGRELGRQLASAGHDLVLVARRRDRLTDLAEELRGTHGCCVQVSTCDISEPDARDALLADVDGAGLRIDVLVCCAGFGMGGPITAQDSGRVQLMLRTNMEAVIGLCQAIAPGMQARRLGAILIVSSVAGNQPMPNFGAYSASKAAVTSFAESLHAELRPSRVGVTVLCPGDVTTEFAAVADMSRQSRRMPTPLKIGPEECARAGLNGLARGRRKVVPRNAVRVLQFVGAHAPRGLWLRVCQLALRGETKE